MRQRQGGQRGRRGERGAHGDRHGDRHRGRDGKLPYIPPCGWNGWDGCTPALGPCGPWVKNCAPYFGCGPSGGCDGCGSSSCGGCGGCGDCGPFDERYYGCGIPDAYHPLARRAARGFSPFSRSSLPALPHPSPISLLATRPSATLATLGVAPRRCSSLPLGMLPVGARRAPLQAVQVPMTRVAPQWRVVVVQTPFGAQLAYVPNLQVMR